jgi:late competence protein required for DNA uptake (superfamily II DNA/RNA helicase)
MAIQFKQKCSRCKNNYVIVSARWTRMPTVCYECQKNLLVGEINDPAIKELFDIPEKYFIDNAFLRDIKIGYLKYGSLSEKQIEAFKKAVEKMKEHKEKPIEEDIHGSYL